jgi:hypothetical protein
LLTSDRCLPPGSVVARTGSNPQKTLIKPKTSDSQSLPSGANGSNNSLPSGPTYLFRRPD